MTRKCKNWLDDFLKWTLPRSEAAESYVLWTGLFTISCALKRHVKVPKTYLGSWEIPPHLYIIFVGPAGNRKTTTTDYAEDLLEAIPTITRAATITSASGMLQDVTKDSEASIYVLAGELSEFFRTSTLDMFSVLTHLFDGKKHIKTKLVSREVEYAERPCVNFLGATTSAWIKENMPEEVLQGGFARRVIFVYEDDVRQRVMYHKFSMQEMLQLQENLTHDLQHIATNIHGDFEITPRALDWMEKWYQKNGKNQTDNYRLVGYYETRPAYVHKLAMINRIIQSDELVIDIPDFEQALKWLEPIEKKLPMVFKAIGKNPYAGDTDQILDYIREKKRVSKSDLFKEFYSVGLHGLLDQILTGLVVMQEVSIEQEGLEFFYVYTGT